MTEYSWHWSGTTVGDATLAPYDDDTDWSDLWRMLFGWNRLYRGVIPNIDNELIVTCPAGATVRVATGWALVDGKFYRNSANVDFTVSGNAVYWLVGLKKDWTAKTIRLFCRGTYASVGLAYASMVQTDGLVWEIPLAVILTTAGGNVSTITDGRHFLRFSTSLAARRQGGSADAWGTPGNSDYPVNLENIIYGSHTQGVGIFGNAFGNYTISFPTAYVYAASHEPIVIATSHVAIIAVMVTSVTVNGFDISWYTVDGSLAVAGALVVQWIAIGEGVAFVT